MLISLLKLSLLSLSLILTLLIMFLYMLCYLASLQDYKLLKTMNEICLQKYQKMGDKADKLTLAVAAVNAQYKSLEPFFGQIDELHANALALENVVSHLDEYSLRLENEFKEAYQ